MAMLPIIMGPQGPLPRSPATLRARLTELVSRTNPGYINNLPGSLIEDVASTDVGALVICDQFLIDLINSVTPYGANAFILNQLGTDIYGIQPANAGNTSVDLIFSGPPGFVIIPGFTVGDGSYHYICTDGGIIGKDGDSLPVHAVSTTSGNWAVPAGTVNGFITAVPSSINLTVTNPTNGLPSTASETMQSFRTRTFTAGLAASTGMDRYLKTLLWNIPGVVQRLVSVRQEIDDCKYTIIVGGGDPYQVAWAIYYALPTLNCLNIPNIDIVGISNTNPIVITTDNNHNLITGMIETITGVGGMTELNNNSYAIIEISDVSFSIPVDGTSFGAYTSGGIVSPNPIIQQVIVNSYPDSYLVPFVLPAQQVVTIVVTWQTDANQYVSEQAMAQNAGPAIVDYINGLYVGVTPISIYAMEALFIDSVNDIISAENLVYLNFAISFDGISQIPIFGSGVIYGDPNSYFYTTLANVVINQAT